jgi:hypothetical protein
MEIPVYDPTFRIPGHVCSEKYKKIVQESSQLLRDTGYHISPGRLSGVRDGSDLFLDALKSNSNRYSLLDEPLLPLGVSKPEEAKNIKSDTLAKKEKSKNDSKKNEQAFLKLIRVYEHNNDNPNNYYKIFGGGSFKDDETHPFELRSPMKIRGHNYTAAGAYQITRDTWRDAKKWMGKGFYTKVAG